MKVVTLVTTVSATKKGDKLVEVWTPPGVVDLDDDTANELIARGQAKTLAEARAEAEEQEDSVQVKASGNAPRVRGSS